MRAIALAVVGLVFTISSAAWAQQFTLPYDAYEQGRQSALESQRLQLCNAMLRDYRAGRGPPPPAMCFQTGPSTVVQPQVQLPQNCITTRLTPEQTVTRCY
jgi:hypothetical protein